MAALGILKYGLVRVQYHGIMVLCVHSLVALSGEKMVSWFRFSQLAIVQLFTKRKKFLDKS